jgi:hypothetical protein
MASRGVIFVAMLGVTLAATDVAHAQLSPRGLIGEITRPFRAMFGRFGHFPRRHPVASAERKSPDNAPPSVSGLGQAGPPAWPNAFEDVVGFVFSPDEYAQAFHSRGFDVIADTITGHIATQPSARVAATTGSAASDDANNDAADSCNQSLDGNNWPAARIEQLIQLQDAQHRALVTLQAAVNTSAKSVNGDCRASETSTAPDRLKALIQTFWTVRDGGNAIHAPLKNFLDTLSVTQKSSFASHQPNDNRVASAGNANNEGANKQYQACAAPNVEAAERMIKDIEQRVRPNQEQAASLEYLHKTSSDMAKLLMASCAKAVPNDPLARLDAAGDELTSVNYAATTVQVAFEDFYAKLDKGQKARLDQTSR